MLLYRICLDQFDETRDVVLAALSSTVAAVV